MEDSDQPKEETKMNYFQKLWHFRRYLKIEAYFFFLNVPDILNSIAFQNFPLEKACRINLGYNKTICEATLQKAELGITCEHYNFTDTIEIDEANQNSNSFDFNYIVCKAESETQKLNADVNGKCAPAVAIFPLIVLLFVAGWADRYNKRKPCMIIPCVGYLLSYVCLLISAIYFDDFKMEFGRYLPDIFIALFGGSTLLVMATYSYMTIVTPEKDRVFRFGIFSMFNMTTSLLFLPMSGWLFKKLGYTLSFSFSLAGQVIATFYVIFFIKEPKPSDTIKSTKPSEMVLNNKSIVENGSENIANELKPLTDYISDNDTSLEIVSVLQESQCQEKFEEFVEPEIVKQTLWRELFDYTLLKDFVQFPFAKRSGNDRLLINLLLAAYFLLIGPLIGEGGYFYLFALRKFGWNGTDFSIFNTFSTGMAILGTFIGTTFLSKTLKFTDSTIGIFSNLSIISSRVIYAFAETSKAFYIAGTVDMFVSLSFISIKSMGSSIVFGDELSKLYSIFGLSETIGLFIFPPLYSAVYQAAVETFPGAVFLIGEIFYIPCVLVFVYCYFLLRRYKSNNNKDVAEDIPNDCITEANS